MPKASAAGALALIFPLLVSAQSDDLFETKTTDIVRIDDGVGGFFNNRTPRGEAFDDTTIGPLKSARDFA